MTQTDKIDISKIRPQSNYVLLKVQVHNDKIILAGGTIELWLDTSYSARHTSVVCTVEAVPDKLTFSHELGPDVSMNHETTMEMQVGDTVICSFLAVYNAFNDNTVNKITVDGQTYFFVKYEECYVVKRMFLPSEEEMTAQNVIFEDGCYYRIIPLNGILLAEEMDVKYETKLIIPEYLQRKKEKCICTVSYAGSCNTDYWDVPDRGRRDDDRLKAGMKIIVDRDVLGRYLEVPEHATFIGDKVFNIVERNLVHAFYDE